MAFLKNTISLLAVFCVVPAAFAVSVRPSITNAAASASSGGLVAAISSAGGTVRRMPTVAVAASSLAPASTTSSSSLLGKVECMEAYTECIKGEDSCGSDFSECTTNVLFHAQMPDCVSTLAQCSSEGINSLFGTSSTTALYDVEYKNEDGEVTRYKYPTAGSVLGQMITAAEIENKYDTQTCVKRYMNCLHKDDVCGEDFELCTTTKEFKKQALFCDSTLARCQSAGVTELLGKYPWSPIKAGDTVGGRIAAEIENGADLAALNAVSTCYKVVDNCFVGACKSNPLRCIEGTSVAAMQAAQGVVGEAGLKLDSVGEADVLSNSQINRFLRSSCADTIGSNKYCHMTFLGKTPSKKDLSDPDYIDEVFSSAHNDRKSILTSKIQGLLQEFDANAKKKCTESVMNCVMRTCGGGSGAACYTQVFSSAGGNTINGEATYDEIATGCSSIANTDPNCLYAFESVKSEDYSYAFTNEDVFTTLFPKKTGTSATADPIGLVASLNSALSLNYNDAAIANMKKQCQSVANSCVKSLCGTDYVNCYRNRTDIYSTLTNTGDASFDKSMNKVGGVLDYTIVLGLCVDTVKNAPVCEEHLAIERAKYKKSDNTTATWGSAETIRAGWYDAGSATEVKAETEQIQDTDENGNKLCSAPNGQVGVCNTVEPDGTLYSEPVMVSYTTYVQSQAAQSLFKDLIYDLEKEAQAKYNAKLTKQQNECMAENSGGIMGNKEIGSAYMWVKLKNNKVPASYPSSGLKASQFVASNELYGSFCRLRVTLQSEDKYIQDMITKGADWSTTYFAAGDAFTCGSWIPQEKLEEMAKNAGKDAREQKEAEQPKLKGWMAALGAVGLGTGGMLAGDAIQGGSIFGGLNKKTKQNAVKSSDKKCSDYVDGYDTPGKAPYATALIGKVKKTADKDTVKQAEKFVELAKKSKGFTTEDTKAICGVSTPAAGKACVECTKPEDIATCKFKDDLVQEKAFEKAKSLVEELEGYCELSEELEEQKSDTWWKQHGGQLVGGVVGAGVGAGLAYAITESVQNAELDKAEQEAIKEFMENVGSKIHCYIGADPAGIYGDVIETRME
ncbi:MAG: PE/PPE C-terminal domain-containing protein [Alphaproteobacteria bacterium]|nr:PE/PPE C-terminal domain-containing protein [Alphaproteobacteria bacterium]